MTVRLAMRGARPHSSHWGAFGARWRDGRLDIEPHPDDPAPSPLLRNIPAALRHPSRIAAPLVRRGWLERGPGPDDRRGRDEFVSLGWDETLDLLAAELDRVVRSAGPQAIFGGSYGWSSAGRFHHAQSQLHRFLNTCCGGYVRSVNTYSNGAGAVILPHILASADHVTRRNHAWQELAEHSELILAFGGIPVRNAWVSSGGNSRHVAPGAMERAAARGARFVLVSPIRDDLPAGVNARWRPIVPGTDVALMLALAQTLVAEGRHDRAFVHRYCAGYDGFEAYLLGRSDGRPKDAAWAETICGIAATEIRELARELAAARSLINVSYSLQRAECGEQPVWMGVVLAALLGQIGLQGGGFMFGLGSIGNIGKAPLAVGLPTLPQGANGVGAFIPVARIADMLLAPGEPFDYDGRRLTYPDIRLVYWAGGNPFHHHQDLTRLARAFSRPDTIVVHDSHFTASARHADFVLPATVTLEREDIGAAGNDPKLVAMHKLAEPYADARDDFDIFAGIARRLGREAPFTEGRTARQWLAHLYEPLREELARRGVNAPAFEEFWEQGEIELPTSEEPGTLRAFRADPAAHPLVTPSGKVELASAAIAGFGYPDCPGHPAWIEPSEWLGGERARAFPLQLIANQPAGRLHSQLDFGDHSSSLKVAGRERLRIHPDDAARRGIRSGDVVRVFNDRGACLAGAEVTSDLRAGVVQLPTGAWWDPQDLPGLGSLCVHGNPNVLTRDIGSSRLGQGCAGQRVLVEVERFEGAPPPVRAHRAPEALPPDDATRRLVARRLGR